MLYIGTNTEVQLLGLTNGDTGVTVDSATVTATLSDADSNTLSTFNVSSVGSGGNYTGYIPATITSALISGNTYCLKVVAVVGGIQIDERYQQLEAMYRGFDE